MIVNQERSGAASAWPLAGYYNVCYNDFFGQKLGPGKRGRGDRSRSRPAETELKDWVGPARLFRPRLASNYRIRTLRQAQGRLWGTRLGPRGFTSAHRALYGQMKEKHL